ncbi:MAG: DUF362 domain-containing protein [Chloroflexi bacterium]|nr:DUF362 domain-containing protein [Chloroflexota bacterium]
MASRVYFMDYGKSQNLKRSLDDIFPAMGLDEALKGKRVAVKLHMGEEGNPTHIRPGKVRRLVDRVKEAGGKPFLCDTTTLYPYKRFTAKEYLQTAARNGFSEDTMGCPIMIIDGDGYDSFPIPLEKKTGDVNFDEVPMAKGLLEADFLLVLTHFKGHCVSGFGGSLKNVGMGCVDKTGKSKQHSPSRPLINEDNCIGCSACADACGYGAIEIADGKVHINYDRCMNCTACFFTCKNECIYWKDGYKGEMILYMVHMASAVLKHFENRSAAFNFVEDITPLCDCAASPGSAIFPNIGLFASLDTVAADAAALDMIDETEPLPGTGVPEGPDRLGKFHGVDGRRQIIIAEELGAGASEYELVRLQ